MLQWCARERLADRPTIRARFTGDQTRPADAATRRRLDVGSFEAVRYRHVELSCGGHVLSEADNWYVPSRLTADMNIRLDRTDKPFGVVVKTMDFRRRTLAVQWRVKSVGHGPRSGRGASPPHIVLRHVATLLDANGRPFSLVVESYTSEVLAAVNRR